MIKVLHRSLVTASVACLAVTTACGAGSDDGDTSPTPAPSAAEALPITAHVLAVDALPGLTAEEPAEEQDPEAFARAHEKKVADLLESGFVSGATQLFDGPHHGFALSIAGRYDDPAAARTEADRLFASNSEPSPGMTVEPLEVPGVPEAQAVMMSGAQGGRQYVGVEIVFVDDTVLHEVFAVGEESRLAVDDVVDAATDLHDQVAGHPVE